MDGQRFDEITRSLAGGASRRRFVKGLGSTLLAAAGLAAAGSTQAKPGPKKCTYQGSHCKANADCCGGTCCNRVCCGDGQTCCGGRCHNPCPAGQVRDATCTCVAVGPEPACRSAAECPAAASPCHQAVCTGGVCGTAILTGPCGDGGTCVDGTCVEPQCSATRPCPDLGFLCWPDVCVDGSCTQAPLNCDDGNPCTEVLGCSNDLGCQRGPRPAGLECPGGFCDGQDTCLPPCSETSPCLQPEEPCLVAVCEGGVCDLRVNDCDDGNPCTEEGFCQFGVGCVHPPKLNGTECPGGYCDEWGMCRPPCVDATECLVPPDELCIVAVCEAGICHLRGKDCNTGNPCTYDYCEEGTGCISDPGPHLGLPCPTGPGFCGENGTCV